MNLTIRVLLTAAIALCASAVFAGEQWSNSDVSVTPEGNVHYHGPFGRETVSVTSTGPAKHNFIRISFDLLIIHTWDGNWKLGDDGLPDELGPDSIRVGLQGGPTLLYTTFSNVAYVAESAYQNYPSPVPGDPMPAQAGTSETNTHGFLFPYAPMNPPNKQDSTYHIEYIVPHHEDHVVVQIQGINLQDLRNESWGVANFKVEAVADNEIKPLAFDEVAGLFDAAMKPDGDKRMESFAKLVCGMDVTVTWIQATVAAAPIDADRAKAAVKNLSLDDRVREVRDGGMRDLLAIGPQAEVFLRDERNAASAETRARIDQLLQHIVVTPIEDENTRKVMLAARVLEIIGTPAAMELRRKLVSK